MARGNVKPAKGKVKNRGQNAAPSTTKIGTQEQATNNVEKIIDKYNSDKSALIQILLEIQKENRWLPQETLMLVSKKLDVPLSQVYRVATFYKAFSLIPQGRHLFTVCMGTQD
jgi:NADH:ubiquinone oxidoreductase subunit E